MNQATLEESEENLCFDFFSFGRIEKSGVQIEPGIFLLSATLSHNLNFSRCKLFAITFNGKSVTRKIIADVKFDSN